MPSSPEFVMPDADVDEAGLKLAARRLEMYSTKALAAARVVDRIIVRHAEFERGLKCLDRIYQLGPEFSVPKGLLAFGPPGSGKSTLIKLLLGLARPDALADAARGEFAAPVRKAGRAARRPAASTQCTT